MLQGAIIGLVVALVMMFIQRQNAKKGTGIAGQLERALGERGPLTLTEAAEAVGKTSFMGRGEVAQALNALSSVGKIRILPAPEGTPQLEKVDLIRYERISG
ncbi:MAG: hypothetical protein ABJE95_29545 [Byssovorax sp.]